MPQFAPVARERHAGKAWRQFGNYSFAATEALVPVVGIELTDAALAMPLAFVEQSDRFVLVAVLSPTPGRNLFVGPDGRWLGHYVPAIVRGHPFRLVPKRGSEEWIFCLDEEAQSVVDATEGGEPLFDADGNLAPGTKAVRDRLIQRERNQAATDAAVGALAKAGVIRRWEVKLKTGSEEQNVTGLYRVDEAAMNALDDDPFRLLRRSSALPVAYAQLLSMKQLGVFERLAQQQAQLAQPPAVLPESLDEIYQLSRDALIQFN